MKKQENPTEARAAGAGPAGVGGPAEAGNAVGAGGAATSGSATPHGAQSATDGAVPCDASASTPDDALAGSENAHPTPEGVQAATDGATPPDPMPDEEMLYDLADLFKTCGDTTRIKILYALMGQELCVADIADIIGASQSAVSHQLRTLKQARLVKFQRDGKNVIYALSDDHVYTMLAQGMSHICE